MSFTEYFLSNTPVYMNSPLCIGTHEQTTNASLLKEGAQIEGTEGPFSNHNSELTVYSIRTCAVKKTVPFILLSNIL